MVSLRFFQPEDLSELSYSLDEVQDKNTSLAAKALERIRHRNTGEEFPVTALYDGMPAGFLSLDFGEDKYDLTENLKAVLFRSFSVNPSLQGKGIGTSIMLELDRFIKNYFKDCNEIVLAVNQQNHSAYQLYLRTGYSYEGKSRIGRNGPQDVLSKKV
ncbi:MULTISPECIES: GNAT family N-acetyltransferase [Chryseobacterium]|uniref:GNAT superfamily N-acetyltransferase n=1 Tax=Chryseobacterium camelliae TaxID=1265445 RepID=A0ABU0TD55_9FLAO|nr:MULTISPECIES: GNAT family N-acetyltransferase [Chryseobacterium]MDT3407188.1 GNAT superfamily N-acetyltransferase [Pseudacidovorax intermedius]MDQ1095021.1 GNAT superfamily N-acetyltransferase [Chryseobacterium camelliae]MDQ1098961.1 GNAT superfamily N-acetyltransferase [Chryseobacterium sp. SORGH_AS_1048]MDR6086309.1 GNAT superfamily N-acetyltransferase [Chryseobacterium sp. SORGH_AS_0909]MDR6130681.1 GNAT superfamily N-acetyltransferase [Chryseobacterium sp. SORGH_AS_1175]